MRVALVTGAGSGIGLAVSRRFLASDVAVVGIGRDPARLATLEQLGAELGKPVATMSLDLTTDQAPAQAVALAMERFGRLDCLVNNAGVGSPKPVHETDDDTLDYFLGLMLRAPFRMCREALKVMGSGASMVHISSTYALLGGLRGGAYSAAKAGLHGLSSHLACQYGSAGIRSNIVAPGVVPTDMTIKRLQDQGFQRMNHDMTPSERGGTVQDVAEAVCFLASPAAGWINGQVLAVDGGWSSTKFLSEEALVARREPAQPDWTHSGRARGGNANAG